MLNPRQERFVAEYLVDLNATQAAIRAGYSPKTAGSQGFDLLKKPEVMLALQKAQAKALTKAELSAERTLEEIRRIAFFDERTLFERVEVLEAIGTGPNGEAVLKPVTRFRFKEPDEWTDEVASVVAGIEVQRKNLEAGDGHIDTVVKVKQHDKMKALEMLAKHFKLMSELHEHEVNINLPTILRWKTRPPRELPPASA